MAAILNRLLSSLGYQYYKTQFQPFGLDHALDVKRFLGPAEEVKTVFDVGANEGQSAQHYRKVFPGADIYSFEPVAATFKILAERTRNVKQIKAFQIALGDSEEEVDIELAEKSEVNSLLRRVDKPGQNVVERIRVRTLDSVIAENSIHKIEFLKTDTEGYDLEVLRGGMSTLAKGKIRFILSEATFNKSDATHSSFYVLDHFLRGFGFELVDLYDHAYLAYVPHKPPMGHCNALFYRAGED